MRIVPLEVTEEAEVITTEIALAGMTSIWRLLATNKTETMTTLMSEVAIVHSIDVAGTTIPIQATAATEEVVA